MFSLDDARHFVRVVEHRGFSAAERATGISKSTLSKRVGVLETALGVRLLTRNTRALSLTDAGAAFYRHASAMLAEAETAQASISGMTGAPRGAVRLTASVITARYRLSAIIPRITRELPDVSIFLHATDRMVDVVQESFDIAVRDHHGPLPPSGLVQRRLGFEPDYLVASPDYLEARGTPLEPAALAAHDGLLNGNLNRPGPWQITGGDGRTPVPVSPRLRLFSDDPETLLEAARQGLGITSLPRSVCAADLHNGQLVRVLPGWTSGGATTTLLIPDRRGVLAGVRAVADALALALKTDIAAR